MALSAQDEASRRSRTPSAQVRPPEASGLLGHLRRRVERVAEIAGRELWHENLSELTPGKRFFVKQLRVMVVVARGLARDRVRLRASALTYLTLLSVVPVLAVVFSVLSGVGGLTDLATRVEPFILDNLTVGAQSQVRDYIKGFVQNANAGALGTAGTALLVLTTVSLLGHMERAFNDIWGIRRHRNLAQHFVIYWTMVTLGPLLLGVSLAITASLQSNAMLQALLGTIPHGLELLGLLPVVLTIVAFTALYLVVPNTRVSLSAAAAGGVVGGLLWELAKHGYTYYTAKAMTYNALYGSLGSIPLFIIWIYLTWLFVLFGAEVAYANEAAIDYTPDDEAEPLSSHAHREIQLRVLAAVAAPFARGEAPAVAPALAERLGISMHMVNGALDQLESAGLVHEVALAAPTGDAEAALRGSGVGWVPAAPPGELALSTVFDRLEARGRGLPDSLATDPGIAELLTRVEEARARALEGSSLLVIAPTEEVGDA